MVRDDNQPRIDLGDIDSSHEVCQSFAVEYLIYQMLVQERIERTQGLSTLAKSAMDWRRRFYILLFVVFCSSLAPYLTASLAPC